ncbi:MAG: metallophosphoesterase family protein [Acidobacteria bacterium]|nr:metallophosphoesterase family protein [Acidobacteriota bacterium]
MTMANKQILEQVGAIGDIHGESQNLKLALDFLTQAKLDYIMSVGDIVDGKTLEEVEECLELLQNYRVLTIAGNHERWILKGQNLGLPNATNQNDLSKKSRLFINQLPKIREFDTVAGKLLLCHGLGENDMVGVWPRDYGVALDSNLALLRLIMERRYKFIINGHTHYRMVRRFDPLTIINAGTLINTQFPCFLIANFQEKFIQFYDIKDNQVMATDKFPLPTEENL